MLEHSPAFSGIAVDDLDAARQFYEEVLGLPVEHTPNGMLVVRLGGGRPVLLYPRPGHVPATYTVLNFPVEDVTATATALTARGVAFEHYEGTRSQTDPDGVFRSGGPLIAWFTDPSGNIISVIEGPGLDS